MARSPIFDGVSPKLLDAIKRVGDNYGPYGVRIISGYRAGSGQSQHGHGKAIDVELYDKKTGEKLANYQDTKHVKAYQEFAHKVYDEAQKSDPEHAKNLRWGGYFGNDPGTGKPKYGSLDLMHFDEGGRIGMRGGSWKEGFSPEMQKYWKIAARNDNPAAATGDPSVQAGAGPAAVAAARKVDAGPPVGAGGGSPDAMRKAFLKTIAKGEAPEGGYDYIIGGGRAKDLSQHPGVVGSAGKYGSSTAAGQYQFLKSTWDEEAKKYGYKDFKEGTQDTAAWNYARDRYSQATGRRLEDDLGRNDPKTLNDISTTLGKTWTSLPGGSQPNSNWKGQDFASAYQANLKAAGGGPETPLDPTPNVGSGDSTYNPPAPMVDPTPNVGSGASGYDATSSPAEVAAGASTLGKGIGEKAGDAFGDLGALFSKGPVMQNAATKSSPANAPLGSLPTPPGPVSMIDPKMAEIQRQQLAMAMQRLNSGRLV